MKQDKWWLKKEEKRNPNPRTVAAKANRDKLRSGKLLWCSAKMIMNTQTGLWERYILQGTYIKRSKPEPERPSRFIISPKLLSRWGKKKREQFKKLAMAGRI